MSDPRHPPHDPASIAVAEDACADDALEDLEGAERERRAVALFRQGRVSSGRAAEMIGSSKEAFRRLLSRHQVPVMDGTAEELERDVAVAARTSRPSR